MSSKLYRLNLETYRKAEVTKLPKQQQQILACMAKHCVDAGMKGSDIVDLAKKEFGLETRQKSTVLYAWYARSNEAHGAFVSVPSAPVVAAKPAAEKQAPKTK